MIFQSILFNNEIDLLKLQLELNYNYVDYFIINECKYTLTLQPKPLYFKKNIKIFEKYLDKIIHLIISPELSLNLKSAWDFEYFSRNYFKTYLKCIKSDDIIIINDADEIVDIKNIIKKIDLNHPWIIAIHTFYYFINLQVKKTFYEVVFVGKYKFIENLDIGDRSKYKLYNFHILKPFSNIMVYHFSYLFGFSIKSYIEKIKSFSHQGYNNHHYLNEVRILKSIKYNLDIFRRQNISFKFINRSIFDDRINLLIEDIIPYELTHKQKIHCIEILRDSGFIINYWFNRYRKMLLCILRNIKHFLILG